MRFLFILFLTFYFDSFAIAQSVVVNVRGEGESIYSAQLDASRQALMQVLPQLIAVERKVINDDVKEIILSSANGYIENFQIISKSNSGGKVFIDSRVTVSTKAIEQFNSLIRNNGGLSLSGAAILAEISREKAQSDFLNNILTRSFGGLPAAAVELKLKKIVRDPSNYDVVTLQIEGRLRDEFINSVESTVKSIACKQGGIRDDCSFSVKFFKGFQKTKNWLGGERKSEIWTSYLLPRNNPSGYSFLNFITIRDSRRAYHTIQWSFKGRVVFSDSSGRLIQDKLDPKFIAGLEFNYTVPIWGEPYCSNNGPCSMTVSAKPFQINLSFSPETFGEDFTKVSSMEISSYLNRRIGVNYNKPIRINNIVCDDLLDYLKIHPVDDSGIESKHIVSGCQSGVYHPSERTMSINQFDIE